MMTTLPTTGWLRVLLVVLLSWLGLAARAQAQPDLTVSTPITTPATAAAGGSYAVGATILSTGPVQFGYIGVYLSRDNAWDGSDLYLNAVGTNLILSPHSAALTISVTVPATTVPGSYFLLLVADPLNMERESNEQNNVVARPVTVTMNGPAQLPDLQLWRPSISLNAAPAGGQIGAFSFVFNYGAGSASNVEIGYYLSADTVFSTTDVIMGTSSAGSLGPNNGTITSNPVLPIPASTPPGRYYVLLVVDHLNRLAESDENNNSRALAIIITGTATAVRSAAAAPALHAYPNPVEPGQALRVVVTGTPQQSATTVVLRSLLGQEVLRRRLPLASGTGVLELSQLAAGTYLVLAEGMAPQRLLVK